MSKNSAATPDRMWRRAVYDRPFGRSRTRFLAFRWLGPVLTALALASTGLGVGFFADDYYYLFVLDGEDAPASPFQLYTFAPGSADSLSPFIRNGPYPWWTLPDLKVRFFRPLSSATFVLDHYLFGKFSAWWHLHSVAWYVSLVGAWTLLARRILPGPVAWLAALLFAVDEAHWMPAVWLSNRNALVATVGPLLAVYAHVRWREDTWRPGLPLSLLGFAAGLFGGEAWLGVVAYAASFELFGRRDPLSVRVLAIAPVSVLVGMYLIAYKAAGFGVYGPGPYIDPLSDPSRLLLEMPTRATTLLGGLILGAPAELWLLSPRIRTVLVLSGVFAVVLLAWLLVKIRPHMEPREQSALRWLIPGGLLSLLPVLATFPMNRLTLIPSLAASAVLAVIIRHAWSMGMQRIGAGYAVVAALLFGLGLILAPLLWPAQSVAVATLGRIAREAYAGAPIDDSRAPDQHVYILAANEPLTFSYTPIVRAVLGHSLPNGSHTFSLSTADHVLTRTAPHEFELEAVGATLMDGPFAEICRSPAYPLDVSQQVHLDRCTVTVLETRGGKATKIRVTFDAPLEDKSFVFLEWSGRSFRVAEFPAQGSSRTLTFDFRPAPSGS